MYYTSRTKIFPLMVDSEEHIYTLNANDIKTPPRSIFSDFIIYFRPNAEKVAQITIQAEHQNDKKLIEIDIKNAKISYNAKTFSLQINTNPNLNQSIINGDGIFTMKIQTNQCNAGCKKNIEPHSRTKPFLSEYNCNTHEEIKITINAMNDAVYFGKIKLSQFGITPTLNHNINIGLHLFNSNLIKMQTRSTQSLCKWKERNYFI